MTVWNFDPDYGDEPPLPNVLPQALDTLRRLAREVAPGAQMDRLRRDQWDGDRALRGVLGDRVTPVLTLRDQLYALVDGLNDALGDQDTGRPVPPLTVMAGRVFAGRKPILRGVVDRYFVYPVSPPLSSALFYRVTALPGLDDVLVREQHDVFGWHYHYCDQRKRRSDTLLSFDRKRTPKPASANPTQVQVPLCWESHGVNKAKFRARPERWVDAKRQTIYTACTPDLAITPPLTFKPPSKEAQDVWPIR